jgi:hypothetical protein
MNNLNESYRINKGQYDQGLLDPVKNSFISQNEIDTVKIALNYLGKQLDNTNQQAGAVCKATQVSTPTLALKYDAEFKKQNTIEKNLTDIQTIYNKNKNTSVEILEIIGNNKQMLLLNKSDIETQYNQAKSNIDSIPHFKDVNENEKYKDCPYHDNNQAFTFDSKVIEINSSEFSDHAGGIKHKFKNLYYSKIKKPEDLDYLKPVIVQFYKDYKTQIDIIETRYKTLSNLEKAIKDNLSDQGDLIKSIKDSFEKAKINFETCSTYMEQEKIKQSKIDEEEKVKNEKIERQKKFTKQKESLENEKEKLTKTIESNNNRVKNITEKSSSLSESQLLNFLKEQLKKLQKSTHVNDVKTADTLRIAVEGTHDDRVNYMKKMITELEEGTLSAKKSIEEVESNLVKIKNQEIEENKETNKGFIKSITGLLGL